MSEGIVRMGGEVVPGDVPVLERLGEGSPPTWLTSGGALRVRGAEKPAFSLEEYADRRRRVRESMAELGVRAVVVFRPSSVQYLCGYHSIDLSSQPLLLTESGSFLYIPDFEVGRAMASSFVDTVLHYAYGQDRLALFAEHVGRLLPRGSRVAVEFEHSSVPLRAVESLGKTNLELVNGGYLVEKVRLVLSPAEVRCIERAAARTQMGVEAAVEAAGKPGVTDSSVAAAIEAALLADADSPPPLVTPHVATGVRGGIPHSTMNHATIEKGTTTFLEFSGAHHHYCAPVMRTLAHGPLSKTASYLAELACAALGAVLENARPGVPCSEIARRATEAMGKPDDSVVFHYIFGYPIGAARPPTWMDGVPFHITEHNESPLREGMVFHAPASFRAFGEAAVGLSQTFAVEGGGARVLTHGPAEVIHV